MRRIFREVVVLAGASLGMLAFSVTALVLAYLALWWTLGPDAVSLETRPFKPPT
jgi:hypothetical protein